jgi:hypothetical protein
MDIINTDTLRAAHNHCIFHKQEVLNSKVCGCFYCLANFSPNDIIEWIEEERPKEETARCPKCEIDAVIGSASGYPVTDKNFLQNMYQYYFL